MPDLTRIFRKPDPNFFTDVTFKLPRFIVQSLTEHAQELGEHPDVYMRRAVVLRRRMRCGVYAPLSDAYHAKLMAIHEQTGVSYETLMTGWLEAAIDAHHAALPPRDPQD
ncbi:hypothetical protein [Deinococcus soli (ex Cha et al. 2016)]|uniref:Uncharacterized protein n=2 Tax=Deinococcus soli (ex Cha et al. 2016) TaxID=1309411 RepID=A0AAE4BLE6_9DEIO|nr:hypothetical protein [Deinococcus soli (ex Cha et al. 2016)]MDR6218883.1 hypothetical protein [Deinococcus soli (ex Cha et al. 2016)]MDR6328680.1 hypothetical protein [Deinococcus soli (ex Cha et al. 2016)]MDR6751833.1 hypothetical protein [Deinococcus soli (ex Cha et al. 2016)]